MVKRLAFQAEEAGSIPAGVTTVEFAMHLETQTLSAGDEPLLDVEPGLRAAYVDEVGTIKEFVISDRQFRVPMSSMSSLQMSSILDRLMAKFPEGRLLILRDARGNAGVFCSTVRG